MYQQYKDRVAFYVVYIQEAHASDVWQVPQNVRANLIIASPKDYEARSVVADSCVRKLGIQIPAVIDDFQNSTDAAYTGWPDRLYLVDRDGRIAYKSRPGPYGFKPQELLAALKRVAPGETSASWGGPQKR